jgi:dienelactone hydrolase
VIDLEAGTHRPLIAAPVADFLRGGEGEFQVAWSRDGNKVVVTESFRPLDHSQRIEAPKRPCRAAVVNAESGRFDCLIDRRNPEITAVREVSWNSVGNRVEVQFADAWAIDYEHRGARWHSTGRQRRSSPPLELAIQQGLNAPPVLVAKDARSGRELKIFDPNPQLTNIALGSVSTYSWKSPRGQDVYAGLVKPPDFSPGHRYPLVIQTHGFPKDQSFNSGFVSNTAAAGRALAARGILVLQVQEPHDDSDGTWREATQRGTEVYVAAIDQLAREGLVDPTKVGIAGYSRRGTYVVRAIEEAPERFAAAVVANSEPGSVFGYYTFIDERTPKSVRDFAEFQAGALPCGEGLQKWMERAGGFRTDRIRAPVLISAGDPVHLIALWSLYAPLRDQGKPVELQFIRSGHHNLTKPRQVLAHQELLVDWFDFWLNGHEEPDLAKAEQYGRWREMQKSSNATSATNR